LGSEVTGYGEGVVDRVRSLAGRVDLAFDAAPPSNALPALIELTGDPAHVATIADFAAASLGVKVTGGSDGRAPGALDEAAELAASGGLRVEVARAFPFSQAAEAHRLSQEGHVRGKLVLIPG
jgi:NADPH:quinone reductase-like Zn-dependent oxidoreductase